MMKFTQMFMLGGDTEHIQYYFYHRNKKMAKKTNSIVPSIRLAN